MSSTISAVKNAFATEVKDVSAEKVIAAIRNGKWQERIEQVQQAPDKKAASEIKTSLPAVLWSGTFGERKNEALVQHSGLLCADLDNLNGESPRAREQLRASPNLWGMFTSPSGQGLKAIFRVPADGAKHRGSFRAVEQHVRELTGIQIDESCKDVARLCFVSHDPDAYHNPQASEIEPLPEPERPKLLNSALVDPSERQRIAAELLGPIDWQSDTSGFVSCPGKHAHTNGDNARDCRVDFDAVPTVHCFHNSCNGILDGVNHELRSRIGKAEYAEAKFCGDAGKRSASPNKHPDDPDDASGASASPAPVKPNPTPPALQGAAVLFPEVDPWPQAVDGAAVLNDVSEAFGRYIALPDGAADVLALWCAHAHAFRCFMCSPRLNIHSPERGCGKTTLRDVLALFVPRPLCLENLTAANAFRLAEMYAPTIMADEYDAWLGDNEELRGMLNAGHRKGGVVVRCEGDRNEPRLFRVYTPAALCGIGTLPATLHDRSIVVRLERAKPGELSARFDSRRTANEEELCRRLARFCGDNEGRLETADPGLPDGVFNRLADNWRPLFAVAEVAGSEWPGRCMDAFSKLTANGGAVETIRVQLLADIREIINDKENPAVENATNGNEIVEEWLPSGELGERLIAMPERPWLEANKGGKPINERWLALRLGDFGIKPDRFTDSAGHRGRGYKVAAFNEAFDRYLKPEDATEPVAAPAPAVPSVHPSPERENDPF